MGIGAVDVEGKGDTAVGCTFADTHGGCTIEMWDNETDVNILHDLSVTTCIKLRNYLNVYIERYANCIDEDDQR